MAYFAVTSAVLGYFGVAGFRGGFVMSGAILAVGGAAVAWMGLTGAAQRGTWIVAVVLVGAILAGVLVDQAPLSKGQLRAEADRVDLTFYRLEGEVASGNSRCRPCPALERRYAGPDLAVEAAIIEVAAALATAGYPLEVSVEARQTGTLRTQTDRFAVHVSVRRVTGRTDVHLTFRGR